MSMLLPVCALPVGAVDKSHKEVSSKEQKPNVIVIYADDMGTLDLNCFGAPDLITPNIDAIADQGVKFTQFYGCPVSSASRACLMTGQFSKRNGVSGNAGKIGFHLGTESLAERMQSGGYSTACIGKWHMGSSEGYRPFERGFEHFWGFLGGCIDSYSHFHYWSGPNRHDLWENDKEIYRYGRFFIEESLDEACKFMDKHEDDPFFLYWAVNIPHYPLQPKPEWLERYSHLDNPRRMYAAFISTLDDYVGELMDYLEEKDLRDNTIIIFQSDNGHSMEVRNFGSGGYCGDYRGAKFSIFEGGIRVPAIISWPGHIPEGESRNQIAMNIDWFPTLVELCGLDSEGMDVDGRSLVPVIKHANKKTPHEVLHFDFQKQWAVRKGDWKLIGNPRDVLENDKFINHKGLFLANIKEDPSESQNLAEKYPQKVQELQKIRDEYVKQLKQSNEK